MIIDQLLVRLVYICIYVMMTRKRNVMCVHLCTDEEEEEEEEERRNGAEVR